jgi:GntR family transcriptional regulator
MATKYDRIAADLRRKIQTGQLGPGEQLPVETVLKDDYRVSLLTLRRALDVLEMEGLIEKRHGHGNFVRTRRRRMRRSTDRYQWEGDRVLLPETERRAPGMVERDTGLAHEDLIFEAQFDSIEADADLADAFGVAVGTPLLRRAYRQQSREEDASLVAQPPTSCVTGSSPTRSCSAPTPSRGPTARRISSIRSVLRSTASSTR